MKLDKYCISDEEYYENTTFVSFVITRKCGAGCNYCHWNGVAIREGAVDFEKILEFIDKQGKPNVHFTFYGGEPTSHPSLVKYMKILNDKYENLQMYLITNGLKGEKFFKKLVEFDNLKVTFSYHDNVVVDLQSWLNTVSLLPDANIRLMMTEHNKMDICNLWEKIKNDHETYISPIEQMGVWTNMDTEPITPIVDPTIVDEHGNVVDEFYQRFTNFKHMMCSSGFIIRENGDVLRCWEDMNGTVVYNIMKDSIAHVDKWHLCTHSKCSCEQRFPKMSLKQYGKLHKEQKTG
jgi:MoaA/NifB/PqqE/SkfB family radical SAM enzyme